MNVATKAGHAVQVALTFISSKLFLKLVFFWFVIQALYMAISTKIGIPPDENYHISFIRLYAERSLDPWLSSQNGFYELGEVVKTPFFLYHYLLSLPFRLFSSWEYAVFILRFVNILLGFLSLNLVVRIGRFLKLSPLVINTSLFMMSNTIMFVFLSASVNYDNLFIVLSLLTVLLSLIFLKKPNIKLLIILVITVLAGMLVKISFLPVVILLIPVAQRAIFFRKKLWSSLKDEAKNVRTVMLLVVSISLLGLFIGRYVGNIVQYGNYAPSCTQVLSVNQCRKNGIYARSEKLDSRIPKPATRSSFEYFFDWIVRIEEGTFGIYAHQSTSPTPIIFIAVQLFLVIGFIALVRKIRLKDRQLLLLLVFVGLYTLVLLIKNHSVYEVRGVFGLALQGRYVFAILPLVYLIFNHYTYLFLNSRLSKIIFIFVMFLAFSTASLPSYILTTDSAWHTSSTKNINRKIKNQTLKLIN
jgi:hypothetical protein